MTSHKVHSLLPKGLLIETENNFFVRKTYLGTFFSSSFLLYEASFCVAKDLFSLIMNLILNLVNVESIRTNNKYLRSDFLKVIRFQFEEIDFLIIIIYLATKGPPPL